VHHHRRVVQIDLAAQPDDPNALQRMPREVVPELQAENEEAVAADPASAAASLRSPRLDFDQLQVVLEDAEQSAAESDAAKDAAEHRSINAPKR
jgi:hypothetical protein